MRPDKIIEDCLAIASRVRVARRARGMSQTELGRILGVTFQQVQKYENGSNRLSAGSLATIARVLDTPIVFFFEDLVDVPCSLEGDGAPIKATLNAFFNDPAAFRLAKAFNALSERSRLAMLDMVEAAANLQPSAAIIRSAQHASSDQR